MFRKINKGYAVLRIISIITAVSLTLSATACGSMAGSSDASAAANGSNVLTVAVVSKDAYLDSAIQRFEAQHPGVKVEVQEYSSSPVPSTGDGKTKMIRMKAREQDIEKYVSAVNTQLMSGNGPDIMLLNDLPYEKYIDKSLLVDLSSLISSDKSFDAGKYYDNIFNAVKYKGKLYGMPVSVGIDILEANKELLEKYNISIEDEDWGWEEFEKAAEAFMNAAGAEGTQGMYALTGMDGSMLISSLISRSFNRFVDKSRKTASFDSAEFVELLNMGRSMIDKGYINTDTSEGKSADLASRGSTLFRVASVNSYMDLMLSRALYSNGAEFFKYPGEGEEQSFSVDTMYGINEKSGNKELAWEFLKFLVSDEMMAEPSLVGIPVNKSASQTAADNAVKMSEDMGSGKGKAVLGINGQSIQLDKAITREDANVILEMVGSASSYNKADRQILSILQEETKPFFDGQKTAEETAETIQDRVYTYINE